MLPVSVLVLSFVTTVVPKMILMPLINAFKVKRTSI